MQNSQFERLLKLAARTGDRLIVTDPSGREPVVILPLAEYEGLLDHDSFRSGREDRHEQKRSVQDVSEPQFREEAIAVEEAETEGEFDPEALEEQVMAAMVVEEPEIVPVVSVVPREPEERAPEFAEEPRKPITRRGKAEGEEQFYMEPV